MTDVDYAEIQRRYGGRYLARRGREVIASAESYDELSDRLDELAARRDELVIEYVDPPDVVVVY